MTVRADGLVYERGAWTRHHSPETRVQLEGKNHGCLDCFKKVVTEQVVEGTLICSVILGAADLRWGFGSWCEVAGRIHPLINDSGQLR